MPSNFHFVAQLSMERLLNGLVGGVAIALFAWVLLRLIGRRNSGTRFAVWFCALLGIVVAPFVALSSPGAERSSVAAFTMPQSWSLYLFGIWAGIAGIGLVRVAAGLWHLWNIRRSCTPLLDVDPALTQMVKDFSGSRRPELCVSESVRVPTAIGLWRTAIVVPAWAVNELSPMELQAVVLHELAHLRRWDDWTNLVQKILRALFFFHPAVWWVESRLSLEREMACDDLVLEKTANPRAYAECLVSLTEKNLLQRGLALAQAAVGRMKQTSLRILQILDVRRPKVVRVWQPAPWVVAGFSVVCLASAAHVPRLVAFSDAIAPAPVNAASSLTDNSFSFVPPIVPASYVANTQSHGLNPGSKRCAPEPVQAAAKRQAAVYKTKAPAEVNRAGKSTVPEQPQRGVQIVRTNTADTPPIIVMQEAVFVIMQDPPTPDAVPVMWHVSVWRFAVLPPATQAAPVVSSKSI